MRHNERMIDKEKLLKINKKVGSALSTLALVISVVFCLTVVHQVSTNGYVQIGGFSLFRVVTGSMEPEIPIGSLLVCQKTNINEIEENDIVCFRSLNPQILNETVTHRVINITQSGTGDILLETKGDANLSADSEFVTASNLIGRVNYYSKDRNIMASFVNILTDEIGFLILILFPTLLIAGFILQACVNNMRREIEHALEEKKRAEQEELYTPEEYAAMLDRLKNELVEELKQDVEENREPISENSKTE